MDVVTLLTFSAAFFVFAASPGPDNLTIVARAIAHGPGSAIAYGLGTTTGILFFLALSAFGLSMVAAEMGIAMTVLRYAGAAWLIWTGIRLWTARPEAVGRPPANGGPDLLPAYATGIALNLGNPKMPLFYIALLPNVVGTKIGLFAAVELAVCIIFVEAVVIGSHVSLALKGRKLLASPKLVRKVNRGAGTVMIGIGAATLAVR
jgi:threonine/homoserine/homoserine lactone efflux protein